MTYKSYKINLSFIAFIMSSEITTITILDYARFMFTIYGQGIVTIFGCEITYDKLNCCSLKESVNFQNEFLIQIKNSNKRVQTAILNTEKTEDLDWLKTTFKVPSNWKELELA